MRYFIWYGPSILRENAFYDHEDRKNEEIFSLCIANCNVVGRAKAACGGMQ